MWTPEYVTFPARGEIHMDDKNKNRVPPAFLRPIAHFICFCRYSCADCANRDGPDCDCELLDKDGARIMACDWRWRGEWPSRRGTSQGNEETGQG